MLEFLDAIGYLHRPRLVSAEISDPKYSGNGDWLKFCVYPLELGGKGGRRFHFVTPSGGDPMEFCHWLSAMSELNIYFWVHPIEGDENQTRASDPAVLECFPKPLVSIYEEDSRPMKISVLRELETLSTRKRLQFEQSVRSLGIGDPLFQTWNRTEIVQVGRLLEEYFRDPSLLPPQTDNHVRRVIAKTANPSGPPKE